MKKEKKLFFAGAFTVILVLAVVIASLGSGASRTHAAETLTGATAQEIVAQMGVGFNFGNTLDATGGSGMNVKSQEISWGNPQITQAQMDDVAAAGFKTVRIPITWQRFIYKSDGGYMIDGSILERVAEVVDYAYNSGLFVIINMHHESWIDDKDLDINYEAIGEKLGDSWAVIADYFADYDQRLIFEGMNEPRMVGKSTEWTGTKDAYTAINYLNRCFTDAVRSNHKGHNDERCLMIPGYAAANSAAVLTALEIPEFDGEPVNNIIVSVHGYTPYNFCLSDSWKDFEPTSNTYTKEIDSVFARINKNLIKKGIPVVLGETGATNKNNDEARENWARYFAAKAASYGVPIVLWDNGHIGSSGGECHAFLNRSSGGWHYPTVIQALMDGCASVEWGSAASTPDAPKAKSLIGANVIWNSEEGLTSEKQWDYSFVQMDSEKVFYGEGGSIAVVYAGEAGEPKIVLDSEVLEQWWMPVDPDRIEELGDKKVAYFDVATILKVIQGFGVNDFGDLRYLSVLAANDNITAYELSYTKELVEAKPTPTQAPAKTDTGAGQTASEPTGAAKTPGTAKIRNKGSELTGLTASQITYRMGLGINIGNSLDATEGAVAAGKYDQEESWGNPRITQELIDAIKEEGFNTVRIPITWGRNTIKIKNFQIRDYFLERVREVVDYAYNNGMFVIINLHHEDWINCETLASDYENIGTELAAIWSQIADAFADYDQHLIFEGMNEPRLAGTDIEWTGNGEAYSAVNYLNKVFVETIRGNAKGYNGERALMIPGYAASSSEKILKAVEVPEINDERAQNIIISVHAYNPYTFCLSDEVKEFSTQDREQAAGVDSGFEAMYNCFLSKGIPVVLGETSATDKGNTSARETWSFYVSAKAASYGVPLILWDNGNASGEGGESHAYINRTTYEWYYPTIIQSLKNGMNSVQWASEVSAAPGTVMSVIIIIVAVIVAAAVVVLAFLMIRIAKKNRNQPKRKQ